VKRLLSLIAAGAVLSTVLAATAEAGDKRPKNGRAQVRQEYRSDRYFRDRDVVVIREYYRPTFRALPPGLQKKYARTGYLPPGWAKRMRPVPVYIERDMVRLPQGYRRGVIDGRAVVYDNRGFILDQAVLF